MAVSSFLVARTPCPLLGQSGHSLSLGLSGLSANDPKRTLRKPMTLVPRRPRVY